MKDCRPLFRDEEDVYVFREFLERLRQHGSDLLVTGEVPQRVTNRASRTLFGDNIHDRKRVLALTDAGISTADEHFPADVSPDDPSVWLIDRGNSRRALPQAAASIGETLPPLDGKNGLHELREEIVTAIGYYDDVADGVSPAELRVCVDSSNYLVDQHEPSPAQALSPFHLCHHQRSARNGALSPLRAGRRRHSRGTVAPLFDARIELRQRNGDHPDHRWHVPVPRHDDRVGGPINDRSLKQTKSWNHSSSRWRQDPGIEIRDPIETVRFELYTPSAVEPTPADADSFYYPRRFGRDRRDGRDRPPDTGERLRLFSGRGVSAGFHAEQWHRTNARFRTTIPPAQRNADSHLPLVLFRGHDSKIGHNHTTLLRRTDTDSNRRTLVSRSAGRNRHRHRVGSGHDAGALDVRVGAQDDNRRTAPIRRSVVIPRWWNSATSFTSRSPSTRRTPAFDSNCPCCTRRSTRRRRSAYFLGAEVVPTGGTPKLVADDFEYSLESDGTYEENPARRLLRRAAFLDCLVPDEGYRYGRVVRTKPIGTPTRHGLRGGVPQFVPRAVGNVPSRFPSRRFRSTSRRGTSRQT